MDFRSGLLWRGLTWALLACACHAAFPRGADAAGPAVAPHIEQHRELIREFQRLSARDPKAALAWARAKADKGAWLAPNDPVRGDALDVLVLAHMKLEEWAKALVPATEAVRIRKAVRPVDQELLALALGNQAVILFALERQAEADLLLKEQLDTWRAAFGKSDLRLAQKLEGQAEFVQKGFGRTRWMVELLQEAVDIRKANPGSSAGKLAGTLQDLAIQEMLLSEYTDADAHLAAAEALLQREMARDPANEELRAGLSQTYVLRGGIASHKADKAQALAFVNRARTLKFGQRLLQVENDLIVAGALTATYEDAGDTAAAIAEQNKVLDILLANGDLIDNGSLDRGSITDAVTWLGRLYLEQGELDLARQAITLARKQAGDTSDLLFKMSELERKSGNAEQSLTLYRRALKGRKETAAEATVFFGTNRLPLKTREPAGFGSDVGNKVTLGRAVVLVPGGEYSNTSWLKSAPQASIPVGFATNAERLVIRAKATLTDGEFRAGVQKIMGGARLYPKSALVFVHGFNVKFDAALQRAGQLARDLNYDGPLFVFSWPSKGNLWSYGTDRDTADKAATSLETFLADVEGATGAARIHLIAHSMGNRVMLPALVAVAAKKPESPIRGKIGEVILAAPAVPQKDFPTWLNQLGSNGVGHYTLYASAVDKAMIAGYAVERATVLAGHVTSGEPLLHRNVHSIDVSEAALGLLNMNHDVFASNPIMTEDMRQLLQTGERDPARRIPTLTKRKGKLQPVDYWYYSLRSPAKP